MIQKKKGVHQVEWLTQELAKKTTEEIVRMMGLITSGAGFKMPYSHFFYTLIKETENYYISSSRLSKTKSYTYG